LVYCDEDNDGFGEFTLTDADQDVTGGVPLGNLVVTYHYELEDAVNGVLPLASPYLNDVPFLQTVHVRLFDQTTGCYSLTTLDLIVNQSPQIIQPQDLIMCDDDTDGIEIFDLTQVEPELLNGTNPATVTISYYEDINLSIAIANPTVYSNIPPSPQIIYILVENIVNLCQSQTTVQLWVNLPPVLVAPTPLELCDATEIDGPDDEKEPFDLESKTNEITAGDSNIVITYYETQADADTGTNPLSSPYINIANTQTVFIRAEGVNTGCILSQGITLDLVVNPLPSPVAPIPFEVCDVDNDGFAFFTLTDKDLEIIGGEPDVTISYYETLIDAESGSFALTSPYLNIEAFSQIIFVRAEYSSGLGCFRVIEMELRADPTPIIPIEIDEIVMCDPEADGIEIFDLTIREDVIYGTQVPSDYLLTYHISQPDATAGTNAIANPETYTNTSNPQTIWVRLEDNTSLCLKVGSFEIRAEEGPEVIQPNPLSQCDDLGESNDGVTLFDLTQKDDEITAAALGVTVHYFVSQDDAINNENEIDPVTAYQNTSNPQVLWVGVTDVNTGCYDATVTLTIRVSPNPDPEDPTPIALCDINDPGDAIEIFDLTIREGQILDGETWTLSYYETYEDAVAEDNVIATPTAYENTSNPQTIYVRATIDSADPASCFEIVELLIMVDPLPDDSVILDPYIICEVPSDNLAVFDLTSQTTELLNGQDPVIFGVSYYESQAEADTQLNPIQNPDQYTNLTNSQFIYVVIENLETGCFVSTQNFEIEEKEGAIANTPLDPFAICDYYNDNDGIAEFDLTDIDLRLEILGVQDPALYPLFFYGTLENAEAELDPLPDTYENTINPQVIYARVTNAATGCFAIVEVILKVELLPIVVLDETYRICIDASGNTIPEEEGLSSPPVIDTALDPTIYIFEWQLNNETILGEIGASLTASEPGSYSVIVTEIATGCDATATTTVTFSSPPLTYSAEVITGAFAELHTIELQAEGDGEYVFSIDDGPFQESEFFYDVEAGAHLITIKDKEGCGSVTIEVGVIDYPRFMTPNADGYHDTWNIIGIAAGDPTAKIYIFDRYGKLLKQLSPLDQGWDGTYNGNPLPSSDYWFRIEYTENQTKKEFKGHFTLKR
jgi:gliding motility-associated-like protein